MCTFEEGLELKILMKVKRRLDQALQKKWIEEELSTLKEANMQEAAEAPTSANVIGLKQVFKAKKATFGNVVWYKARRVV